MGPTSLRDGVGSIASGFVYYPSTDIVDTTGEQIALTSLNIVSGRAEFLGVDKLLDQQPDRYAFFKSAFDQNRVKAIYDGEPPVSDDDLDF